MQGFINRGFDEPVATHPAWSRAPMRTARSGSSAHDEPYVATPRHAAFTEGYARTPDGHHQVVHQRAAATGQRAHVGTHGSRPSLAYFRDGEATDPAELASWCGWDPRLREIPFDCADGGWRSGRANAAGGMARVRGGGETDDELDEDDVDAHAAGVGTLGGEDEAPCTQQSDWGFDEPETPCLVRWVGGVEAGATDLPTAVGGTLEIGRLDSNDLVLSDPAFTSGFRVHGKHAVVTLGADGGYVLSLIGKGQCTFVNEVPLQHISTPWQTHVSPDVMLADGDSIRFGGLRAQNYLEFMFTVVAPGATQPDRETMPLIAAPAVKSKPRPPPRPVPMMPPPSPHALPASSAAVPAAPASVDVMAPAAAASPAAPGPPRAMPPPPAASLLGTPPRTAAATSPTQPTVEPWVAEPATKDMASRQSVEVQRSSIGDATEATATAAAAAARDIERAADTPLMPPAARLAEDVSSTVADSAAPGTQPEPTARPVLVPVGGGEALALPTLAGERMQLNAAAGDAGYIVCSKDATYDLHVRRSGIVAYSRAKGTSWVPLATGKQQPLTDLSLLEFTTEDGTLRMQCSFPHLRRAAPKAGRRMRGEAAKRAAAAGEVASDGIQAAASSEELQQLALRTGQLHASLTNGIHGPERQAALRKLEAIGNGLTRVATAVAGGETARAEIATRQTATVLRKQVDTSAKKRKLDAVKEEHAANKADRRERSERKLAERQASGRAPGGKRKKDKRQYANRMGIRKKKRKGAETPINTERVVTNEPGGGGGGKGSNGDKDGGLAGDRGSSFSGGGFKGKGSGGGFKGKGSGPGGGRSAGGKGSGGKGGGKGSSGKGSNGGHSGSYNGGRGKGGARH